MAGEIGQGNYSTPMVKTQRDETKRMHKITGLEAHGRDRFAYFVERVPEWGAYQWQLRDRGELLAMSELHFDKASCLRSLRAVQRHGETTQVVEV